MLKSGIIILFIIGIVGISCSRKLYQAKSGLYEALSRLPEDTILRIKTYDGSGQVVHPDIIYKEDKNNIGKFLLTLTPYPYYNDSLENPCIYESPDGLNFYEPVAGVNPLVKSPLNYKKNYHHNDDPDISYIADKGIFRIIYLQTFLPDSQLVSTLESSDGISWTGRNLVKFEVNKNEKFILSPAFAEKNNMRYMFYVNKRKNSKNTVEFFISDNNDVWDKNKSRKIKAHIPCRLTPWHLDVFEGNGRYYMLLNGYIGSEPVWKDKTANKYSLYIAESRDLVRWKRMHKLMDCRRIPDSDCYYIYRSTGLIAGDLLAVWYSYTTNGEAWHIGLKKIKLNSRLRIGRF